MDLCMRCSAGWFVVLMSLRALLAQDPAPLLEREKALTEKAVNGLHAVADALATQKQHLRALELRREIFLDYAEHDEKARDKCGFIRVGATWRKDNARLVLDKNLKPDAKAMRKVDQDLATLCKALLTEHRSLADAWAAAGNKEKARHHWERVLRFQPGDKTAAAALAIGQFEGFAGNPTELDLLRRARAIRGTVDWLNRKQFEVKMIEGRKHGLLEAAKIVHEGARSEHFEVWGTLPPSLMQTIAQDAERSLLLCRTLLGVSSGQPFQPKQLRSYIYVHDPAAYAAVLDLCAAQFDAERLAFLKKDVDQAFIEHGNATWRFHKAHLGEAAARDQAVRGVAQDAIGVTTDGLWEGFGHVSCCLLFGRTLTFLLEQQHEKTVAQWTQRPLLPDLAVWQQIAEESAWAKSDTRVSQLVLISAARFSTEQRVKAWAVCDYLMLTRPELLLELDSSQSKQIHTPPEVEAEFKKRTKVDLPTLDLEWRDYWAKGALLRKAMSTDPIGDEKAPDRAQRLRARSLVDAVNDTRASAHRGPVGFFVASGGEVDPVVKYGEQLAKAEAENLKKPKVPVPLPTLPPAVGRSVFWSRRADAPSAVAEWMMQPALRDVLLDPGRGLCGAPLIAANWILDVAMPAQATKMGAPLYWPRNGQTGCPGKAVVAALGPRAATALAEKGKQPNDEVGMPLSLHFSRAMKPLELSHVGCRVYVGHLSAEGVLVVYEGSEGDADTAAGCLAFVPLQPLGSGKEVEVEWKFPKGMLGPKDESVTIIFTVQ
jgi:tetratricopeptide (TPR) repeat protein